MKIDAILSPAELPALAKRDLRDATCVVFDVLRATSTFVTALYNGAKAIIPVSEIAEALALRQKQPDVLLGGERDGVRIRAAQTGGIDFDLGNSPREYTPEMVERQNDCFDNHQRHPRAARLRGRANGPGRLLFESHGHRTIHPTASTGANRARVRGHARKHCHRGRAGGGRAGRNVDSVGRDYWQAERRTDAVRLARTLAPPKRSLWIFGFRRNRHQRLAEGEVQPARSCFGSGKRAAVAGDS